MNSAACLICKNENQKRIAQRKHVSIFKCSNCQITFAIGEEKRSNVDNVVDTHPGFYETTMKKFDYQLSLAKKIVPVRIKEYSRLLGRPCERVLEIGCGTGAYAKAFDELDLDYTAVELDPEIARFAIEKTQSKIVNEDFTKFQSDTRYDVVFASQVFEHILEPDLFLKKVTELAPGGLLHLDVPNHLSLIASIRKYISKTDYGFIQPPYHMISYTPDVLRRRLEQNGFSEVKVFPLSNDDPTWGQLNINKDLLNWALYRVAGMFRKGSLLTAIAKVPQ